MQDALNHLVPSTASPSHSLSFLSCVSPHTFVKSLILFMDQLLKLIMDQSTLLACTDQQKCFLASPLNVSLLLEMASPHIAFVLLVPHSLFCGGNQLQCISRSCHLIMIFDRYLFWNPLYSCICWEVFSNIKVEFSVSSSMH